MQMRMMRKEKYEKKKPGKQKGRKRGEEDVEENQARGVLVIPLLIQRINQPILLLRPRSPSHTPTPQPAIPATTTTNTTNTSAQPIIPPPLWQKPQTAPTQNNGHVAHETKDARPETVIG